MRTKTLRSVNIANDIIERIDNGEFKESNQIPTQSMLISHYKASSRTIAETIEYLKANDYIITRPGKGTFIKHG